MKYILILIASIISAILYRAGGMSKKPDTKPTWIPIWMRHTKTRDLGLALITMTLTIVYAHPVAWWIHLIAFLGVFGCLTTYWDDLFGYDNFYFHGFMIGLMYIMYLGIIPWYMILARADVMGLFMGIVCALTKNDVVEEFSRGAIITASLPLII